MKNNLDIESFLRESRPQVKENPTFLLEVQHKMRAVYGIKAEVDRQRRYGRMAIVAALFIGLVAGAALMAFAYLYPIDPRSMADGLFSTIMNAIEPWKQYLMIPIAGCATALGLMLATPISANKNRL